jgi:hypothetical protein
MYYFYDAISNSLIMPTHIVPMMRRFDIMEDAVAWFDKLIPATIDGKPADNIQLTFQYYHDARDEVIDSHATTLADAIAQCPGPEYDLYLHGLDSFGYHLPVNCENKFNTFFKPKDIRHNDYRLVEIVA